MGEVVVEENRRIYADLAARSKFQESGTPIQETRAMLAEQYAEAEETKQEVSEETKLASSAAKLTAIAEDAAFGIEVG